MTLQQIEKAAKEGKISGYAVKEVKPPAIAKETAVRGEMKDKMECILNIPDFQIKQYADYFTINGIKVSKNDAIKIAGFMGWVKE